jgi:hypothetical protein
MDLDAQYFVTYPDRKSHIRKPRKVLIKDVQRSVGFIDEEEACFLALGDHKPDRRRIVLLRVDFKGNFPPDNQVLKLPVLLFADEEISDQDDVLVPLCEQLMLDAVERERGKN